MGAMASEYWPFLVVFDVISSILTLTDYTQFWYAEFKDQQSKLAGALQRMMNRKLSMAWEQWQVISMSFSVVLVYIPALNCSCLW